MVVVKRSRGPLQQIDAYNARQDEADELIANLARHEVLYLRQTPSKLELPFVLSESSQNSFLIDLTLNAEELLGRMARSTRHEINKIERERERDRIEVRRNTASVCEDFLKLYNNFSLQNGYVAKLSAARLSRLLPFAEAFVVYANGQPVCGHFDLRDQALKRIVGLWSASTHLESSTPNQVASINRWLHWRQMKVYKAEGFDTYDLGPADSPGIRRFKRALGASETPCHGYVVARGLIRIAASVFLRARGTMLCLPMQKD